MQQISVEEAQTMLPVLIQAALMGEDVTIMQDPQAVVRLVPVTRKPREFGGAKGLIILHDDFDEPLDFRSSRRHS